MQGNTPPGSKKRKLSDNESPSAKQLKTSAQSSNVRHQVTDGDHEVSSSSEAETITGHLQTKKVNTLDKFFKPRPFKEDQEEISSTNECIEIDLTGDNDHDKGDQVDSDKTVESSGLVSANVGKAEETGKTDNIGNDEKNKAEDVSDNKENLSADEDDDVNSSFIANTSVCEDALKTPSKDKLAESLLKVKIYF